MINQKIAFPQLNLYKINLKKQILIFAFLARRRQCPKNANPFEVLASNAQKCEPFANFHRNCEPLAASGEHLPKSANPLQNVRKSSNPLRMSAKSANPFEVSTSMCPKVRTLCESPPKVRTLPNSGKGARSCCKPRTLSPKFAPKGRHHTIDQKRSFSQLNLYKNNKKIQLRLLVFGTTTPVP